MSRDGRVQVVQQADARLMVCVLGSVSPRSRVTTLGCLTHDCMYAAIVVVASVLPLA